MSTWLQTEVDIWTNTLRAVIAAWLNASQCSRYGVGVNKSARGWSVKRFEQSQRRDTAPHKNVPNVRIYRVDVPLQNRIFAIRCTLNPCIQLGLRLKVNSVVRYVYIYIYEPSQKHLTLCILKQSDIRSLQFAWVQAARIYTICRWFVAFIYCSLWEWVLSDICNLYLSFTNIPLSHLVLLSFLTKYFYQYLHAHSMSWKTFFRSPLNLLVYMIVKSYSLKRSVLSNSRYV